MGQKWNLSQRSWEDWMDYRLSYICWKIAILVRCRLSLAEFCSATYIDYDLIFTRHLNQVQQLSNLKSTFMLYFYSISGFSFSLKNLYRSNYFFQTRTFFFFFFSWALGNISGLVCDKLWKLAFGFGLAFSWREQLGLIWVHSSAQFKACPVEFWFSLCCSPEHAPGRTVVPWGPAHLHILQAAVPLALHRKATWKEWHMSILQGDHFRGLKTKHLTSQNPDRDSFVLFHRHYVSALPKEPRGTWKWQQQNQVSTSKFSRFHVKFTFTDEC